MIHFTVQVFIEYVMLDGINCSEKHAHELGQLLSNTPQPVVINLIPWNPVLAPSTMSYAAPASEAVREF